MRDVLRSVWKWIEYNRFLCAAIVIGGAGMLFVTGCESTTADPFNVGVEVTRAQLDSAVDIRNAEIAGELETEAAKVVAAYDDLDVQDERKLAILQFVKTTIAAVPGVGDYAGYIFGALALGGIGDNIRKRKVIKRLKAPAVPA